MVNKCIAADTGNVYGGRRPDNVETIMRCDSCGTEVPWLGNFLDGVNYKCPCCGKETFHGISRRPLPV